MGAVGVYEEDEMTNEVIRHYDGLIAEENDPFRDPPVLQEYMDKWDGAEFLNALALNGSETVLEIGVGTGRIAAKTAPLCAELFGLDISPKTIERAKENLADFKNIQLICDNFLNFDLDRKFDVVYSSLTFMHFEDKQMAVNKVAELLCDGGKFVLSIDKNRSESIDMGSYRLRVYPDTSEAIISCARNAGLCLKAQRETEFAHIMTFVKA